jgi:VanZ family protein
LDRLVQLLEDWGLTILLYPFYLAYRYQDKFAHVLLYLGFGLLLNRAASSSQNGTVSKYAAPFSLMIGGLYALSDEVHQTFVPYRTASPMDLVADFVGLLCAQLLVLMYFGIKRFFREKRYR